MAKDAAKPAATLPVPVADAQTPRPWWRPLRAVVRKAQRTANKISGRKPIEGFVDRILAGEVLGWAFDPNKPSRRVHVVARLNGEIVAETLADLPRKDLVRNSKGDGRHGFNLRIPAALMSGDQHLVRIEAAIGRRKVLLRGGEVTVSGRRPNLMGQAAAPKTQAGGPSASSGPAPGVLEKVVDRVLIGWAAHPKNGGASVVVDVYDDERYLGSVTADRPRPRLQETARGARGFHFRLPSSVGDESLPRLRARIAGTRLDLKGLEGGTAPRPARAAVVPASAPTQERTHAVALLVLGDGGADAVRRTIRSWTDQAWPDILIGRIASEGGAEGEHVFSPAESGRIEAFIRRAETVIFVRPGEMLEPSAATAAAQARPLADVMTWDIGDRDGGPPMRRRSEAWPLALLLGGSLGGGFAVRAAVCAAHVQALAQAPGDGGRAFELALAGDGALRWAHLAGALSSVARAQARPPRLEPKRPPARARSVTVAVWPKWSAGSLATALQLCARLADRQVEVLVPNGVAPPAGFPAHVVVRGYDAPERGGVGAHLRALGEAASGEAVIFCRAGETFDADADIAQLADWSLSPLAGGVTGELAGGDQMLSGVTVSASRQGWRIVPAYDAARAGLARPVLACPAALLAVDRAKLAAAGGFDQHRFPDTGAAFDLCLRLRRMGWHSLVLGGVKGYFDAPLLRREASAGLVNFDLSELAAAAAAYPPPGEGRGRVAGANA